MGDLNLSPGRSGAAEILNCDLRHTVTEVKLVGNKLILKGIFALSVLYRGVDGALYSTEGELPFSLSCRGEIFNPANIEELLKVVIY